MVEGDHRLRAVVLAGECHRGSRGHAETAARLGSRVTQDLRDGRMAARKNLTSSEPLVEAFLFEPVGELG